MCRLSLPAFFMPKATAQYSGKKVSERRFWHCVCVYSVSFSDTALTVTGQGDAGCSSERAPLNWMWKE